MIPLRLERDFPVDPEVVFTFVTKPDYLLLWWGHEGAVVTEHNLDFSKTGAWLSVLMTENGSRHKVSGNVIALDPPHFVEFTWAWHDKNDVRGHNSIVRFEISSNDRGGAIFVMTHSGLLDEESVADHKIGWESTLEKLERIVN